MSEDALIRKYFSFDADASALMLGPGDDAALLRLPPGVCALSTDLFLQGAHFDPDTDPEDAGFKALAVNLSDLAAMGASPVCFTLALAMPRIDEPWLAGFSRGLQGLAKRYGIALAGGDLSCGALAATITVLGTLEGEAPALRRDAAQVGDAVGATGTLGDARLARMFPDRAGLESCVARLQRPEPRVAFGHRLRGHAHAAMDVSDGLFLDLQRLLHASGVGAHVELAQVPLSAPVAAELSQRGNWFEVLGGGEDYELVFTAPEPEWDAVRTAAASLDLPVARIGTVTADSELRVTHNGAAVALPAELGHDHFTNPG